MPTQDADRVSRALSEGRDPIDPSIDPELFAELVEFETAIGVTQDRARGTVTHALNQYAQGKKQPINQAVN